MDRISPERRSWNMSRVKSKDTGPELILRSALHRAGFRYSLRRKDLPGKPDIVMPSRNTVVFVHGCFWHQHKNCPKSSLPESNKKFWEAKLMGNVKRDASVISKLKAMGWRVIVVWECQLTQNPSKVTRRVIDLIIN